MLGQQFQRLVGASPGVYVQVQELQLLTAQELCELGELLGREFLERIHQPVDVDEIFQVLEGQVLGGISLGQNDPELLEVLELELLE